VVGVPLAASLGQAFGWRAPYWAVAVIGAVAVAAVWSLVPQVPVAEGASPRQELGALTRLQVWLALLTGSIGFAGFFAVYSYITPTLTEVSGYPSPPYPWCSGCSASG
jgi:DHA1 family inner membrane transport protein